MRAMSWRLVAPWILAATVAAIPFACGGRNLENLELAAGPGGGGGGAGGSEGGSAGASADGGGGRGGAPGGGGPNGGEGAISTGSGNPIECFGCVAENCPEAVDCITDEACINGIACGVQNCLDGGGGPDIGCFVDCFDGDFEAALAAFETLTCVFQSCADACGGLLGGGFPGG
jgi:hypothetical protein